MNKQFQLVVLALLLPILVMSQGEQCFKVGDQQVNFGLGFSTVGVPVYGNFEVAIHPDITVGGQLSFAYYSEKSQGYTYRTTEFTMVGFGNYHFNTLLQVPSNWDTYAGLNLGYSFRNTTSDVPDGTLDAYDYKSNGLFLGIQIGGRYFWNSNWALNFELGGGTAFGGKIGVTYRIP
jgi:outer membrane immunogenic protein